MKLSAFFPREYIFETVVIATTLIKRIELWCSLLCLQIKLRFSENVYLCKVKNCFGKTNTSFHVIYMPDCVLKMSRIPQSPVCFGLKLPALTKVDIEVTWAAASQCNYFTVGKTRSTKTSAAWKGHGGGMVVSGGFCCYQRKHKPCVQAQEIFFLSNWFL